MSHYVKIDVLNPMWNFAYNDGPLRGHGFDMGMILGIGTHAGTPYMGFSSGEV